MTVAENLYCCNKMGGNGLGREYGEGGRGDCEEEPYTYKTVSWKTTITIKNSVNELCIKNSDFSFHFCLFVSSAFTERRDCPRSRARDEGIVMYSKPVDVKFCAWPLPVYSLISYSTILRFSKMRKPQFVTWACSRSHVCGWS